MILEIALGIVLGVIILANLEVILSLGITTIGLFAFGFLIYVAVSSIAWSKTHFDRLKMSRLIIIFILGIPSLTFSDSLEERSNRILNALGQHTASMLSIDDLRVSECKDEIDKTTILKYEDEVKSIKEKLTPVMSAYYEILLSSKRIDELRENQRKRIHAEINELKERTPNTACKFTIYLYSKFHEQTRKNLENVLSN